MLAFFLNVLVINNCVLCSMCVRVCWSTLSFEFDGAINLGRVRDKGARN